MCVLTAKCRQTNRTQLGLNALPLETFSSLHSAQFTPTAEHRPTHHLPFKRPRRIQRYLPFASAPLLRLSTVSPLHAMHRPAPHTTRVHRRAATAGASGHNKICAPAAARSLAAALAHADWSHPKQGQAERRARAFAAHRAARDVTNTQAQPSSTGLRSGVGVLWGGRRAGGVVGVSTGVGGGV